MDETFSAMIALKQPISSQWLRAVSAPKSYGMVKAADFEPEKALAVQQEQAARLTRLRSRLGLDAAQAAKYGMVDRDAWGRMERGSAKINPIALQRFISAVSAAFSIQLAAEYVITGRLIGLDEGLLRELAEIEAAERRGDIAGISESQGRTPRGRKRQKRMAYTAT